MRHASDAPYHSGTAPYGSWHRRQWIVPARRVGGTPLWSQRSAHSSPAGAATSTQLGTRRAASNGSALGRHEPGTERHPTRSRPLVWEYLENTGSVPYRERRSVAGTGGSSRAGGESTTRNRSRPGAYRPPLLCVPVPALGVPLRSLRAWVIGMAPQLVSGGEASVVGCAAQVARPLGRRRSRWSVLGTAVRPVGAGTEFGGEGCSACIPSLS
jgi:hypothetical protein